MVWTFGKNERETLLGKTMNAEMEEYQGEGTGEMNQWREQIFKRVS